MKKTRKIAALIAALTLATCSIAPVMMTASATDDATTTITITDGTEVSGSYSAYQILTATVNEAAGAYTYHLNSDYATILQTVT